MARRVRLHSPSHPDLLLHRASELRHVQALCDVLVRVGQQDFLAHSLVLACASHTLARLLLPQGPRKLCNLDFLAPATFKHALDFAYTGSLEVAPEELTSLLATARDLEMEELEQACLRALGTGGPDGTGIGDRAGSHESVSVGDRTGGYDGVAIGDKTGGHGGVGERTGGHDGVAISDRTDGPDEVGIGNRTGCHDGVGIGDWAGRHDEVGAQDVRKETEDGMSQIKSPGNHDLVLLADGPCLGRPDSKGSQIQDGSLAPSWVLFEQSSLKPRESIITATARPLPQEHRTHPWPPEVLWGPEGVVSGYQPYPPLLSYQLQSLPSPLGNLGPGHMALSASVGFHGYVRPFPCRLEMGKPGTPSGIMGREKQLEDQRLLAVPAKSSGSDLCPQRGPDTQHLPLLCHPRPRSLPLPRFRAQRSCDKDLLPLSTAPPGEPATAASTTLYLMYGPRCPPRALPAGTWSYICQLCQRQFPSQMALRRHSRSHMGQRLLERDFCARGFQAEAGLRGPQRASPGEKPYECGECSKRFTLKHQMETHYRVHTGEKPFQCKLCPQRSRDYSAMIKHLRTHGGAAPYRCTLCCQFCPSLAAMQKHMKGHCPEELPSDWTIETTYLYSSSTSS
ncbi:zinc finger and BTB domain-containing protein 32 [Chelonoidis abingdonii]|uniref:zinc finger and BTB domain-containing protein 32 n=1 Tax=Chelonoidis abingdonii TaxID=106734 RepID=UPI0013F1E3C7|nr:zinc finger and BTB domain-containing protein 32 [Chelonoidis abingdonii]